MNWKSYLQSRTRDPRFLWRVVLAILAVGGVLAVAVHVFVDRPDPRIPQIAITDLEDRPGVPGPDPPASARSRLEQAIEAGDWWRVWWLLPVVSWTEVDAGAAAIAALTALFWLLFLLQAGHAEFPFRSPHPWRFWGCLIAVGLGALSTWPTLFVVIWQEEAWGFGWDGAGGLAAGLKYFVLGVGLREELLKLLLFLPLVPWLMTRRDELEWLIVAACVGLGFAAEENMSYFTATLSRASVGRYLTANAFHFTATGLAGLWLCRALRWPKVCGPQFLAYLGLLILAHGAYDALIAVPELAEYSFGSILVFVAIVYAFFRELRELRPARSEVISLTANFVVGLAILVSVTFVYVTAQLGLPEAGRTFLQPAIAVSIMAYVILREVPESLVRT